MIEGPENVPIRDYLINAGMAVAGGSVRFLQAWRANLDWTRKQIVIEALMTILTAGFVGVLTFLLLRAWGANPLYSAFAVGIMGHAGVEGINLLKEVVANGLKSRSQTPEK